MALNMARTKQYLAEQIARAKRVAAAMNTDADRQKFEELAARYQNELDTAETEGQSSATSPDTAPSEGSLPTNEAVAASSETGASASAPQTPTSSDDQEPTIE
jgi:hypothetical protein